MTVAKKAADKLTEQEWLLSVWAYYQIIKINEKTVNKQDTFLTNMS